MADQKTATRRIAPAAPTGNGAHEPGLSEALQQANMPTLVLSLATLTGDDKWLNDPYRPTPPRGPSDHDSGGFSAALQASIRRDALKLISDYHAELTTPAAPPTPEKLERMLGIGLADELPEGYGPLLAEELGVADRHVDLPRRPSTEELSAIVIGAGFSGLLAAYQLGRAGISYTVLEKDANVGGTWHENTYPGCGVDTPTHLYSLSFAQHANWSRYFAKRDELFTYLERVATEHDLKRQIRFGLEVTEADWSESDQLWHVRARDQEGNRHSFIANVIISGVGFLNRPAYPDIEGLESFDGPMFHTARWRDDVEIAGKRVAVIGTGASAMQLVPNIAGVARNVTVFQRSPQWGIPHPNYMRSVTPATQLLMREVPYYLGWYRARLVWTFGDRLHQHVQWDPDWPDSDRSISEVNDRQRKFLTDYIVSELGDRQDLLDRCLPTYPPYGKRPLLDNGWFRTMTRDDVELVTDPVEAVTATGIRTSDGEHHEADVIVLATGFQALRVLSPMTIRSRSGKTLRDVWGDDDARAHLGIAIPDFPNFFCLLGPNTFAGHGGSGVLTIELEMRYVMELLALMVEQRIAVVDCRQEVHDAYNDELDAALAQTIWAHPGMTTYYRNSRGRIVVPMPWSNVDYWHRTRRPNLDDYRLELRQNG